MEDSLGSLEGLECTRERRVEEHHLAEHLRERGVEAVSTPSLLYFAESTLRECIQEKLPPTHTTVGVGASIRHYTKAPRGALLEIRARVLSPRGPRVTGYAKILQGGQLVAEVFNERRIVEVERLLGSVP